MNKTYLLLGSNMGDSQRQLVKATRLIEKKIGRVIRCSRIYCTAAWGKTDQPDFMNQVIVAETGLPAIRLMQEILLIEKQMGRVRTEKNAPRIIDIDILYYNKEIIRKKDLVVPHPAIQLRRFVLVPLNELAPNFIHPVWKKTNHQLLINCSDVLAVKKI